MKVKQIVARVVLMVFGFLAVAGLAMVTFRDTEIMIGLGIAILFGQCDRLGAFES